MSAAGTTGTVGPNLDDVLPGQSPAEISEDITDPNAQLASGFHPGVMPANYRDLLDPEELQQLVQYLLESVGGGGK